MQNKLLLCLFVASSVFFTSCGGNDANNADTTTPGNSDNNEVKSNDSDKAERATITVTIKGGDMEGTYTAVCRDACCSWGIAGDNTFGNQYSETGKGPKELSSVQLIVDDVKEGSKTTKEFLTTVSFGELFTDKSTSFNINTRKGASQGSGTVDVQYSGDKATVHIQGVSKEGPSLDVKIECSKVMTPMNLGQ